MLIKKKKRQANYAFFVLHNDQELSFRNDQTPWGSWTRTVKHRKELITLHDFGPQTKIMVPLSKEKTLQASLKIQGKQLGSPLTKVAELPVIFKNRHPISQKQKPLNFTFKLLDILNHPERWQSLAIRVNHCIFLKDSLEEGIVLFK